MSAKRLGLDHSNPECPYCGSKAHTHTTLKRTYKKFSGQSQKKHETEMATLFDFDKKENVGIV